MLTRRPVYALVAAMLLWAPTLKAFLGGGIDVYAVCTRFLVAFAVAYVGVTILGLIVAGYGQPVPPAAEADPLPRRRRADLADVTALDDMVTEATFIEATSTEA